MIAYNRAIQLNPKDANIFIRKGDTLQRFLESRKDGLKFKMKSDKATLEELCQIAEDVMGYPDEENSWYYSIGCVLGNMSTQVFPATPEECQQREAEYRHWQEEFEQELAKAPDAESFEAITFQEA